MEFIKRNWLKFIIGIIIGIILFLGYQYSKTNKNQSVLKLNPKKDTIYTPKIENIQDILILAGSIDASSKANLRFQTSGQLIWIGAKVGDSVKKWQTIAKLDTRKIEQELIKARNDERNYQAQVEYVYDQVKDHNSDESFYQKQLRTTAEVNHDNSVTDRKINEIALKLSTLISPIDGIVTDINIPSSGVNVASTDSIFKIIDPKSIYFKAQIDQESVAKIKIDQKATLKLDGFPDSEIESKINYISFTPVEGQTSTVYEARFDLPNNDLYRLGMDGDISIVLSESKNVITIPTDAVYDDNGQKYAYIKTNNQLVRKNITIGIENDTKTEIKEGITQNDQVAVIPK